jgi:hypothetical protein
VVDILEAASLEFADAAEWYEERAPGLRGRKSCSRMSSTIRSRQFDIVIICVSV